MDKPQKREYFLQGVEIAGVIRRGRGRGIHTPSFAEHTTTPPNQN